MLVYHLVQELQIVCTVVQRPAYAIFDEVLGQVHVVIDVVEGHLWLNHPELRQMARRIGVFSPERRSERIDGTERCGPQLTLELAADGERGGLAKEIVAVIYFSLLIFFDIVQVFRRNLEHLAGSLAVAGRYDGRMEIVKAVFVEVAVDGHRHVVAYSEYGAERIGAKPHVSVLAHILERLSFLLHGVFGATSAKYLNGRSLKLHALSASHALHKFSVHAQTGAGGDFSEHLVVKLVDVGHDLNVLDGRAVVEGDKIDRLASATCSDPAFYVDVLAIFLAGQGFDDSRSLDFFHDFGLL